MTRTQISGATKSSVKMGPGFEELVPKMVVGQEFSLLPTLICRLPVGQHGAPNTPGNTCLNIAILSALEGRTCLASPFALCGDS